MMYSSVGDEDRRRANEIQEERANLQYQQFNGNDMTATMNEATLNDVDGTLGETKAIETLAAGIGTDATPRDKTG